MSENLLHALYAGRDPASAALCFADGSVLSTGDLMNNVARMATALNELGIRPGDRVSFKLEKSPVVLFLSHACLQLGAIFNPLNISYTDDELTYLVRDAEPRLLVCDPDEACRFEDIARPVGARVATLAPGSRGFLGSRARNSSPLKANADVAPDATA